MSPPATRLKFEKAVRSGAPLARWLPQIAPTDTTLDARQVTMPLPLKPQPDPEQLRLELAKCDDPVMAERLFRKLGIASFVGTGPTCPMPLWVWRIGGALFFAQPNEAYCDWQLELRQRWPGIPVVVMNVTNGTCGYLVPRARCRPELYAFWQSPFDRGAYEVLEQASLQCGEGLMPSHGAPERP